MLKFQLIYRLFKEAKPHKLVEFQFYQIIKLSVWISICYSTNDRNETCIQTNRLLIFCYLCDFVLTEGYMISNKDLIIKLLNDHQKVSNFGSITQMEAQGS